VLGAFIKKRIDILKWGFKSDLHLANPMVERSTAPLPRA
jgi:hypothetical protein